MCDSVDGQWVSKKLYTMLFGFVNTNFSKIMHKIFILICAFWREVAFVQFVQLAATNCGKIQLTRVSYN